MSSPHLDRKLHGIAALGRHHCRQRGNVLVAIGGAIFVVLAIVSITLLFGTYEPATTEATGEDDHQATVVAIQQLMQNAQQPSVDTSLRDTLEDLQRMVDEEQFDPDLIVANYEQAIGTARKVAERAQGDERHHILALVEVMEFNLEHMKTYSEAHKTYVATGGMNIASDTTRDELEMRLEACRQVIAANKAWSEFARDLKQYVLKVMHTHHVPDELAMQTAMQFEREALDAGVLALRAANERLFVAKEQALGLCLTHFGRWEGKVGYVEFHDDTLNEQYAALLAEMDAAEEQQLRLQRQFLQSQSPAEASTGVSTASHQDHAP